MTGFPYIFLTELLARGFQGSHRRSPPPARFALLDVCLAERYSEITVQVETGLKEYMAWSFAMPSVR